MADAGDTTYTLKENRQLEFLDVGHGDAGA
jgi:hypothetical protein